MSTGRVGVAISTTGDPHRMAFLETCVRQWDLALPAAAALFITVDGDEAACRRVLDRVDFWTGSVFRVGQPYTYGPTPVPSKMGVAVSKNTGLELLMDAGSHIKIEHLFLSDDDTWPLNRFTPHKHIDLMGKGIPHSMVCWGAHRLVKPHGRGYASWSWPRGAMLYAHRDVVETVGGMDERFGAGGHEHVEWSRRIHQHGLTPDPYCSPAVYAETGVMGQATRAGTFWHCEDMRRLGEPVGDHRLRRRQLTSIKTEAKDWDRAEKIMVERDGDTSYVPFRAHQNGRASATLIGSTGENLTGLGAGGEK